MAAMAAARSGFMFTMAGTGSLTVTFLRAQSSFTELPRTLRARASVKRGLPVTRMTACSAVICLAAPRYGRAQMTKVIRSVAISCGSVTESNETTLTWLLPNLSWAWFFLAPSW